MASRSIKFCSETRRWSPIYRRERPWARRQTRRLERHSAKRLLQQQRYDEVDTRQTKGTQGWLTW